MPLLTITELEKATPLFRGKCGNAFCKGLMRMLAVDKVNGLYDRNSGFGGPKFASAILKDIGVEYEILNADVLGQLPDGPVITPEQQAEYADIAKFRDFLRNKVYNQY